MMSDQPADVDLEPTDDEVYDSLKDVSCMFDHGRSLVCLVSNGETVSVFTLGPCPGKHDPPYLSVSDTILILKSALKLMEAELQ
jgi:hypothetical protein